MILSKQCQDARGREHRRAVVAHDEARYDPEAAVRRHGDARHAARPAEWGCLVRSRSTAGGVSREQFQCGIQGLRAVGIRLGNIMEEQCTFISLIYLPKINRAELLQIFSS